MFPKRQINSPDRLANKFQSKGLTQRVILMTLFFCLASISISYARPFGPSRFPGIRVNGTVTDSSTKQYLPTATVSAFDEKGVLLASTKTNSQGYYQISTLKRPKTLSIRVDANGYSPQTKGGALSPYRTYTINFSLTPNINRPPSISLTRYRTIRENQRFSFRIYAYDPDKDALTYSAIGLPQRAVFDQRTRLFSWTPAYGQEGTYTITFEVSDGKLTDSKTATIIVRNGDTAPPTGSLTINNNAGYTNSLSVTVNLTAKDNPGGSGLNQMQFSTDNKTTWSSTEAFNPTKTLNLASPDGLKTVYAKFSDNKGNWSSPVSGTITLDTIPPRIIITSPKPAEILIQPEVTLQGTIDGEAFTETRTLTGNQNNTLTKTATDAAGNLSSAQVTVFCYTGSKIGPEGGEVTSPDGKVRLVIPPGALIKPVSVLVVPKDHSSLQDITPAGKSLFKIVECRPPGLPLNKDKPAQLIYTLEQAEVPGTPVELGLYDSIQEVITYQGTAYVGSDSYTVSFPIDHFSTYASLKVTEQKPIGAGVKIPLPDMLTGSFSSSIPITVPPGRKGMQPSLSLTYRSSNPNSWTGVGFSLNPGYIVRSTRLGPPTYDDTKDTFYFITDAGTTELVYLIDNRQDNSRLYQAKVESSFSKFYKQADDSWKVLSKDGSIVFFGQTPESKETSDSGTFSWYITEAIDTNGNYLEFHYTKDQGKSYLWHIYYTGNDTAGFSPTNTIEFSTESRDDVSSSYISSAKIATARRLKTIKAYVKGDLVWEYELTYESSLDTNRSLLKSITQKGSDGKSLPVQRFGYQRAR